MLNCCVDLEQIKETGINLKDFQCLALCQGLTVDLEYADERSSLEDFRRAVKKACVESEEDHDDHDNDDHDNDDQAAAEPLSVLVISYNRKTLKQTGSGHFSPIAAYDDASDSVLILDTARFKYGAHWANLSLVYEAMKSIDPDTGKSRGFALLSFTPPPSSHSQSPLTEPEKEFGANSVNVNSPSTSSQSQPASILFRSKMNQNEKRRQYKEFLHSLPRTESVSAGDNTIVNASHVPFEKVCDYWSTDEDGQPLRVWEIVEPVKATDDTSKEIVAQMRTLLRDLKQFPIDDAVALDGTHVDAEGSPIPTHSTAPPQDNNPNGHVVSSSCCSKNAIHKDCVSAHEALFLVYLAALSQARRRHIVMNIKSEVSDMIREQLLKEADLIANAIEMSDDLKTFEES